MRLGHHHRHGLADMTDLVDGQEEVRADEDGTAGSRLQLHVVFGLGQRIMRDGCEAVTEAVGAGEGAEHAGRRLGAREICAENAGMRVRGAHHHRVGLTVEAGIIAEPPATRDQPLVFLSHEWLADEAEARRREFAVEVGHRRLHLASGC